MSLAKNYKLIKWYNSDIFAKEKLFLNLIKILYYILLNLYRRSVFLNHNLWTCIASKLACDCNFICKMNTDSTDSTDGWTAARKSPGWPLSGFARSEVTNLPDPTRASTTVLRTSQNRVLLRCGAPQIRKARIPGSPRGFVDVATGMDGNGETLRQKKLGGMQPGARLETPLAENFGEDSRSMNMRF